MKKLLVVAVAAFAVALGIFIYLYFDANQDKNAMAAELESTQNILVAAQSELASIRLELASVQADLSDTNDTLNAAQTELDDTKKTLTATIGELSDTRESLASTESELETTSHQLTSKTAELAAANNEIATMQETVDDLENSLSESEQQLEIAENTLGGLGITVAVSTECTDVELVDNPQAQDPTWQELMSFLAGDKTEQHEYIEDVYDCSQFSRDLHNKAEAAGIRAAEVQVAFTNTETGHALNAFITTDYGLVYIDCTTPPDNVARIKQYKEYRGIETYAISGKNVRNDAWWDSLMIYYYISSDSGGHAVVSGIKIYW